MEKKLVIIPTYKEVENIAKIISAVFALEGNYHILVIDDGSPDGTADVVKSLQKAYTDTLFLIQRPGKMGLGTAYVTGFRWALDHGYDYVFEAAGNPATMHMAFEAAANKAHVCLIGTPHKDITFTPAQWELMNRKEFLLTGSWMSYSAPFPGKEWKLTAHYFATGQLKFDPEFLYKTYPMSQAAEAFQEFHHPQQVHGKIMLVNE